MKFYTFSPVAAPSLAFVTHHMNLLWTGSCYYYVFQFILLRVFIYSNDIMTESNLQYSIMFFFSIPCASRIYIVSAPAECHIAQYWSVHPLKPTCSHTFIGLICTITPHPIRMFVVYVVLPAPASVANVVYTNNKDEICIWAFFTIRFRFSNTYPARCSPAFYI